MLCSIVMFDLVDLFKIDTNRIIAKYFDIQREGTYNSPLSD